MNQRGILRCLLYFFSPFHLSSKDAGTADEMGLRAPLLREIFFLTPCDLYKKNINYMIKYPHSAMRGEGKERVVVIIKNK